MEKEEN